MSHGTTAPTPIADGIIDDSQIGGDVTFCQGFYKIIDGFCFFSVVMAYNTANPTASGKICDLPEPDSYGFTIADEMTFGGFSYRVVGTPGQFIKAFLGDADYLPGQLVLSNAPLAWIDYKFTITGHYKVLPQ